MLSNQLCFNINKVSILMRKNLLKALYAYNLTPEQWEILLIIQENDQPTTQRQIIDVTLKDKGNICRIVDRLKIGEWIEVKDGRPLTYSLTPKAIQLNKDVNKSLENYHALLENLAKENCLLDNLKIVCDKLESFNHGNKKDLLG